MHNYFFRYYWIVPFLLFISGYFFMSRLFVAELVVPQVVGLSLPHALQALSAHTLSVRIIMEREHMDLPAGTVLQQQPAAGKKIKTNQSVYITISKKPPLPKAPNFLRVHKKDIKAQADAAGVMVKTYDLEHASVRDRCFAQDTAAGEEVASKSIITYCSSGMTPQRLMPNFIARELAEVQAFLKQHGCAYEVSSLSPHPSAKIIDQRPLPDAPIEITKLKTVYVRC